MYIYTDISMSFVRLSVISEKIVYALSDIVTPKQKKKKNHGCGGV